MRIIVLAARSWQLVDEKTGEHRAGVKIEGCEATINNERDYKGSGAVEYSSTPEAWQEFQKADVKLPGIFDVEVGLRKVKTKNGASVAAATIERATFVSGIEFVSPVRKAA